MVRAVEGKPKSGRASRDKAKDARDREDAEKHIARTIGDLKYTSGSGANEQGACGFCHELREEKMVDDTGAERVCRMVECGDLKADIRSTLDRAWHLHADHHRAIETNFQHLQLAKLRYGYAGDRERQGHVHRRRRGA